MPDSGIERQSDARLRVAMTPGLGAILTRRLLDTFGTPEAIVAAGSAELAQIKGISRQKAEMIRRAFGEADVESEKRLIAERGVTLVGIDEPSYPALLRHINDPPPLLFVRGELRETDALALGVVGSRKCSPYGREQADRLGALCAQAGLAIVSGGAYGIDAAAHRATLRVGGRTIAVLGCGHAKPYPPEHAELFDQIVSSGGAVVTELAMGAPPLAQNFPSRNRIISGMSLGVLVIEAALRSGALITARLAAEDHCREVMALPGRVDAKASAGCHKILREGWATLVTSPADILEALGDAGTSLAAALDRAEASGADEPTAAPSLFDPAANLTGDARAIYDAIGGEATAIDAVVAASGVDIAAVQSNLMQLQLTGLIERLPGNRVKRRAK